MTGRRDAHDTRHKELSSLCSAAHLELRMKFRAPYSCCVFTLQLKGKGRAAGLKAASSWLQTPGREVDALYCCLHQAVYPSNVQIARDNPPRPSVPVLVPALTNAALPTHTSSLLDSHTPKHLIYANVRSVPSERSQLPLHLSARKWKTCEGKRKKGSREIYCPNDFKCFQELLENSWTWMSATELLNILWQYENNSGCNNRYNTKALQRNDSMKLNEPQ